MTGCLMSVLLFVIGSAAMLGMELACWLLFEYRIRGIAFPPGGDASQARFFTVNRIRLCAVAHALFLITCLCSLLLAW